MDLCGCFKTHNAYIIFLKKILKHMTTATNSHHTHRKPTPHTEHFDPVHCMQKTDVVLLPMI